jgi:hypothetical protein
MRQAAAAGWVRCAAVYQSAIRQVANLRYLAGR